MDGTVEKLAATGQLLFIEPTTALDAALGAIQILLITNILVLIE